MIQGGDGKVIWDAAEGPYISGGLQSRVVSVRSLIKECGSSSGLVIELRRIISNPKLANAWLELRQEECDWYIII